MTERLKKYLEEEINYNIYKDGKENNNSDEVIEKYLDSLYKWINYIENNLENPLATYNKIVERADKLSDIQRKYNYISNLLKLLEARKSFSWQMKEIKSSLNNFLKDTQFQLSLLKTKSFIESFSININNTIEHVRTIEKQSFEELSKKKGANITSQKNQKTEIKLIEFIIEKEKRDSIIMLIYKTFQLNLYIKVEYEIFVRHFYDNKKDFVKISWLSNIEILKAFVDLLLLDFLIKPVKHNNIFISSHFTLDGKEIKSRNLGDVTSYPSYRNIYEKKDKNHPIVKLINEIINHKKQIKR